MADNGGSRVLHVDADAMVVYTGENGIHEDKENVEDYSFVEAHYPYLKRKYEEDNSERNSESDVMFNSMKKFQRRENFSDAEKCDLVDVICSEELEHDEEICEKFIIRLRSRTTPNKFKKVLYEQIATKLESRGYKRRDSVSIKRMWNQLFGDYQKAVNFLKTKAGINGFKHKPWIMKIYEAVKENNLPDHLFMETDVDETEAESNEIINTDHSHDGSLSASRDDDNADDCDSNEHADEFENDKEHVPHVSEAMDSVHVGKSLQKKQAKSTVRLTAAHSIPSQAVPIKAFASRKNVQSELAAPKSIPLEQFARPLVFHDGTDQLALAVLETTKSTSSQKLEEMTLLLNCYSQEKGKDRELEREKLQLRKVEEEHKFIIEKMKMDFAMKFGYLPAVGIATPNHDKVQL